MDAKQQQVLLSLVGLGLSVFLGWRILKTFERMDGPASMEEGSRLAQRLQSRGFSMKDFTPHELAVCCDLVFGEDLEVDFSSVAGLEEVKRGLEDAVIKPFRDPKRYASSKLLACPKGVLLYGPPGNGKSMLAAALAKECGACFLNVRSATLFQKYWGESEKCAAAYFSLARKIAPCVLFVDEVDLVLSRENAASSSSPGTNKVVGVVLSEWDGLLSSSQRNSSSSVVVVAASNSPASLDAAMHRRLPRQFFVGPPDTRQRLAVLEKIVLTEEPNTERALLERVARETEKYCGSDLLELCKAAASCRARDVNNDRPFQWRDFEQAMKVVRYAGASAERAEMEAEEQKQQQLLRVLEGLSRATNSNTTN